MAILLFVGCDKTGKSTLMKNILKRTNQHICVDRFTPCQYVYGRLHNKNSTPSLESFRNLESFLTKSPIPVMFVHVFADTEDIKKRFIEHDEKDIDLQQIDYVKQQYRQYLENTSLKVLNINTSKYCIDECMEQILLTAERLL